MKRLIVRMFCVKGQGRERGSLGGLREQRAAEETERPGGGEPVAALGGQPPEVGDGNLRGEGAAAGQRLREGAP